MPCYESRCNGVLNEACDEGIDAAAERKIKIDDRSGMTDIPPK